MQELSVYFRALADRKRLRIVKYLAQHERVTVTQLGTELRLSQPLISWHLRMLRRAGIVNTQRDGRQVWCSLNRRALQSYERRLDSFLGLDETTSEAQSESASLSLEPTHS